MKLNLPVTGFITLESDESKWMLLERNLINELRTSAIINISPERKVRIKLTLTKIAHKRNPPENSFTSVQTDLNKHFDACLSRIYNHVITNVFDDYWIFIGYIEGATAVPVVIMYFPMISLTLYTKYSEQETPKEHFPNYMQN